MYYRFCAPENMGALVNLMDMRRDGVQGRR